jgi:hypothetical protein
VIGARSRSHLGDSEAHDEAVGAGRGSRALQGGRKIGPFGARTLISRRGSDGPVGGAPSRFSRSTESNVERAMAATTAPTSTTGARMDVKGNSKGCTGLCTHKEVCGEGALARSLPRSSHQRPTVHPLIPLLTLRPQRLRTPGTLGQPGASWILRAGRLQDADVRVAVRLRRKRNWHAVLEAANL